MSAAFPLSTRQESVKGHCSFCCPQYCSGWENVRACRHMCACVHERAPNLFSMALLPGIMQNISVGHISQEEKILTLVIQVKVVLSKLTASFALLHRIYFLNHSEELFFLWFG